MIIDDIVGAREYNALMACLQGRHESQAVARVPREVRGPPGGNEGPCHLTLTTYFASPKRTLGPPLLVSEQQSFSFSKGHGDRLKKLLF